MATFAAYVGISFWKDQTLLTAQAFTSVALVSLLTAPVIGLFQALPSVIQCLACFNRIEQLLNYPAHTPQHDLDGLTSKIDSRVALQELPHGAPQATDYLVTYLRQDFRWSFSGPVVLHGLEVSIPCRRVTAVVGPVGSGKSTLLESILGETLTQAAKESTLNRPIAYCSQDPWLENKSIYENIIGALPFEQKWYNTVVQTSALIRDLQTMPRGDQTVIASNALNVSGGQKKRIVRHTKLTPC